MALGYGLGDLISNVRRSASTVGLYFFLMFLFLRSFRLPGDPGSWEYSSRGWTITLVDFLNPSKYPPSLQFVLMTLGAALMLTPILRRLQGPVALFLERFGQVALFFHLLHIPAYHGVGIALSQLRFGTPRPPGDSPLSFSWLLGTWILVLVLLYPLCLEWLRLKRRRRDLKWLRYL